jgi:GcrA cell cycle regulator
MRDEWTPETIAQLRQLWAEGHSTARIAEMMRRSKNGIIGKVHRLGLPSRPSPISGASSGWDDAADAELRRLWRLGDSAKQIGVSMGRTENQIEWRARVLCLPLRGALRRAPVPPAPAHGGSPDRARALRITHALPRPARVEPPVARAPAGPPAPPITGGCRWPMWPHATRPAYGEHRFCDGPRFDAARPYCAAHHAEAHVAWVRAA